MHCEPVLFYAQSFCAHKSYVGKKTIFNKLNILNVAWYELQRKIKHWQVIGGISVLHRVDKELLIEKVIYE